MIPVIEIIRLEESVAFGTFGILKFNKMVFCCTLELNDEENSVFQSSIPAQQYLCKRHQSTKFGEVFKVMDVPGRSDILFHKGNTKNDTAGCILLGERFGKLRGDIDSRGILNSGDSFKKFMQYLIRHDSFHLTIREVY